MDILVKPILTEKATNESELRNSYTFIVSKDANKIQIKKAIEESYGVSVIKVRDYDIWCPINDKAYQKRCSSK